MARDLHAKLLERNRELEAAGYHAQVHVEAKTSLVFLLEGERRITLRRQNGDYASKDRHYSAAELMDLAEQLSPNALLRPVVQDYMLPTVAYVGGPAELAYMAQSQVLYEDLLQRMPVMLARGGFTLLDARTAKLMEQYGLTLPDLFHGEDGVRELIAQQPGSAGRGSGVRKNSDGHRADRWMNWRLRCILLTPRWPRPPIRAARKSSISFRRWSARPRAKR